MKLLADQNRLFQIGQCVRLNSGGPLMTVDSIDDCESEHSVHVVWFDGHALQRAELNALMLQRADDSIPW